PDVNRMVDGTEFDTIYHEHLSYFGIPPLAILFRRHGLFIRDVASQDVHGGSMRLTVRRSGTDALGTYRVKRDWPAFNARCLEIRESLIHWLTEQRDTGK